MCILYCLHGYPVHSELPGWHFGIFHWFLVFFHPYSDACLCHFFSHFAMKIVIEGNQQKVKKNLTKKNFGFFFLGKGKKWTRKLVILKADFQPTSQFVADAMGIKWKPYFRGLIWYMPRCAEMRGNLSKLTFFGPENSTKKALFQGLFFGFFG